ncbi:MAG: hybrid sensor histidine kinase/response regulator [Thermoanaerobaculia bacterium]
MKTGVRYSLAVVATLIAIALTVVLAPFLAPMRFLFVWTAILLTATFLGTGPALLGVLVSIIVATVLDRPPFILKTPEDGLRLTLFAAFATGLSIAVGQRRRAELLAADLNTQLRNEMQERKRHEDNAAFINRASALLATSLNYAETMRNLARLCVPSISDWCAVHIGSDQHYERLAVEHIDPEKLRLLDELGRTPRPAPEHDAICQVLTTRKTNLMIEIDEAALVAQANTSAQGELLRKLGFRSWIIAPIVARGRTLGALTVVYGESGRRYSEHDVPLIEDLARRAAIAIDNARLYEAAEAANRAKDEFLATLSHELRTPLTAISGWAHMLNTGMTDDVTTRLAIATIVRSAKAQAELIDDLLDLSRVTTGTLHLSIDDVDLAKLVSEVVLAAKPAADAKSITLELSAPSQPVIVRGDDRRLRQVVWNLVTNALKFTNEGKVTVTLSADAPFARIEVLDTGRGIDNAFLPHVWDRFRQADSSTSREFGGLGLGLAVVKNFVELHGGTVLAESAGVGHGAMFRVELPLARVMTQPAPLARIAGNGALRGKHILIVDDDDDARIVIEAMLKHSGADVVAARSAADAIAVFESLPIDIVLSDIAMPGEDGYTLVRKLHARHDVPVVAVTAIGTGADDRRRALDAGFVEFVRKPVDPDELVATVARLS